MDDISAIWMGGLANNSRFFGASPAETTSTANAGDLGGWNLDYSSSLSSGSPWALRGAQAHTGANGGLFANGRLAGELRNDFSNRTILLGY